MFNFECRKLGFLFGLVLVSAPLLPSVGHELTFFEEFVLVMNGSNANRLLTTRREQKAAEKQFSIRIMGKTAYGVQENGELMELTILKWDSDVISISDPVRYSGSKIITIKLQDARYFTSAVAWSSLDSDLYLTSGYFKLRNFEY